MSVIDVKEDWQGLGSEINTESASAPRIFTVKFDTADDPLKRPFLAENTAGIPLLNSAHPYKPWLFVKNKSVDSIGPFDFEVTVNYSTRSTIGGQEGESLDPTANPLEMPWEVEWGFATANEPINTDITGKPILNSADESPDPPITREISDLVLRIRRNEAAFNPLQAAEYKDAINSDWFWGFAPDLVRCTQYNANIARSGNFWYWQVKYEFQIRRIGWKLKIVDEGFREKTGIDSEGKPIYKVIKDDEEISISQPQQLDGNGRKKNDGDPAVLLPFDLYNSLPFSVLGL